MQSNAGGCPGGDRGRDSENDTEEHDDYIINGDTESHTNDDTRSVSDVMDDNDTSSSDKDHGSQNGADGGFQAPSRDIVQPDDIYSSSPDFYTGKHAIPSSTRDETARHVIF